MWLAVLNTVVAQPDSVILLPCMRYMFGYVNLTIHANIQLLFCDHLTIVPSARAKPPPNSKTTSHGKFFCKCFHVTKGTAFPTANHEIKR